MSKIFYDGPLYTGVIVPHYGFNIAFDISGVDFVGHVPLLADHISWNIRSRLGDVEVVNVADDYSQLFINSFVEEKNLDNSGIEMFEKYGVSMGVDIVSLETPKTLFENGVEFINGRPITYYNNADYIVTKSLVKEASLTNGPKDPNAVLTRR
jgi:hypothetical protein